MSTYLTMLVWRMLLLSDQDQISKTDIEAPEHFRMACQTLWTLSKSHNSARQSLAALRISVSKGHGDAQVFKRILDSTEQARLVPVIPSSVPCNENAEDTLLNSPTISMEEDVLRVGSDRGRRSTHKKSYGEENASQSNAGRQEPDASGTREGQATKRSLLVDELENVYGDLDFY